MTLLTPVEVVGAFYAAVRERDARAVEELVEGHFHEQASVTWPGSLPYGGTVAGRSQLQKVLAGAARGGGVGPCDLELVALAVSETEVVAELKFGWRAQPADVPIETGAVEWWSFDDQGAVVSMRAYYADTTILLPSGPRTRRPRND